MTNTPDTTLRETVTCVLAALRGRKDNCCDGEACERREKYAGVGVDDTCLLHDVIMTLSATLERPQ